MMRPFLAKGFAISLDCLFSALEALGAIYQKVFLEVGQASSHVLDLQGQC